MVKPRHTISILTFVFCTVGVIGLVTAALTLKHTYAFVQNASPAKGVIVDIVRETGESTYRPVVEFTTASGEKVEFVSNISNSEYSKGDAVGVLYDASSPKRAKIDAIFTLWLLPIVFGFMGSIFLTIGVSFLFRQRTRSAKAKSLLKDGIPIQAKFQRVERNESFELNGMHPFRIVAQWISPTTSELHVFRSEDIWFDPSDHIAVDAVTVYIEKENPSRHHMDISFLPKLAD